jgi:hypothetical protein
MDSFAAALGLEEDELRYTRIRVMHQRNVIHYRVLHSAP